MTWQARPGVAESHQEACRMGAAMQIRGSHDHANDGGKAHSAQQADRKVH